MPHDPLPVPDLALPVRTGKVDRRTGDGSRDDGHEAGWATVMTGEWAGWDRRECGPGNARHTVLLLPGGLCTAVQYEELMAEPALADVRMIAVTVPGMGGTPAGKDLSIENLARLAAQCAADLGCDVVVGFSMGANIALEMSASGAFR